MAYNIKFNIVTVSRMKQSADN